MTQAKRFNWGPDGMVESDTGRYIPMDLALVQIIEHGRTLRTEINAFMDEIERQGQQYLQMYRDEEKER